MRRKWADERTRHLPVIILTSSSKERDRLAAYDHFANSYVVKPLNSISLSRQRFSVCLYWTKLNAQAPLKEA